MARNFYKFEVNMANMPNYLVQNNDKTIQISDEHLNKYSEYIKKSISYLEKDIEKVVYIYGGDPITYIDKIKPFILSLRDVIHSFSIDTNGSTIEEHWNEIIELYNILQEKFSIKLTFDGTVDIAKFSEVMYKLTARGLTIFISVCLNGDNINELSNIYTEFIKSYNNVASKNNIKLIIYLDLNKNKYLNYTNDTAENVINSLKQVINDYPDIVEYSVSANYLNKNLSNTVMGKCHSCLCKDGLLFPGYEVPAMNQHCLDNFNIGTIDSDIDTLISLRENHLRKKPEYLPELTEYQELFRAVPYVEYDNDGNDINIVTPFEVICDLHDKMKQIFQH